MRVKFIFSILFALSMFMGCQAPKPQAKYIFLFIGDGMGSSHVTLAQIYSDSVLNDSVGILFTKFPVASSSTTYAANRYVTCSAAAGTALSTGSKTSINTIGLNADHTDTLYSIAKRFKENGRKVAILSSVSIDHATPAAFYAHAGSRSSYYDIARFIFKSNYDFFASGGFLDPYNEKGDSNSVSIYELGKINGYSFTSSLSAVDSLVRVGAKSIVYSVPNPASSSSLQYEIDRTPSDISLADITRKAIEVVNNPNGFFIMVEGGKIDWAAHDNDGATVVHEVRALSKAVDVAIEFYKKHPTETLILVTADHETGGLSIGNRSNKYSINPQILSFQKASKDRLHKLIVDFKANKPTASFDELLGFLEIYTGIGKSVAISSAEVAELRKAYEEMFRKKKTSGEKTTYSETDPITNLVVQIINEKAGIGWTSGSHTGEPVPVYAIGAGQELFMPLLDITDIPKKIVKAAGLSW